jgi:penicillin V acylase-like amidase (Ntn superfamily)
MKPLLCIAVAITAQLAQTLAAVFVAASFLSQAASACTGLGIEANDGGIVTGRTLEFGADPQSQIVVFPAGTEFVGTVPKGTGLQFKSKYGFRHIRELFRLHVMDVGERPEKSTILLENLR